PAALRVAVVAAAPDVEERPCRGEAAYRLPVSGLPGIHDPLRGVFLHRARGVLRGRGDVPRPRVHLGENRLIPRIGAAPQALGRIARFPVSTMSAPSPRKQEEASHSNFIRQIIEADLMAGKYA